MTMTEEEIRRHPAYREGWDAYTPYYENGRKWPAGFPKGHWPSAPLELNGTIADVIWRAGANSAHGTRYVLDKRFFSHLAALNERTPPLFDTSPSQVQLDLFQD